MCISHFSEEVPAQQATHHIVLSYYHESWSKVDEHKCRGSAQVELRVSLVAYCPQRPRERVGWSGPPLCWFIVSCWTCLFTYRAI